MSGEADASSSDGEIATAVAADAYNVPQQETEEPSLLTPLKVSPPRKFAEDAESSDGCIEDEDHPETSAQ
eukprot:3255627-Amphidinium_carterae.1